VKRPGGLSYPLLPERSPKTTIVVISKREFFSGAAALCSVCATSTGHLEWIDFRLEQTYKIKSTRKSHVALDSIFF
jgi:hypothetical protein